MDVALPKLADTLTEGTLARWLKAAGDEVREGEPIAELETDKISSDLEAPASGVLSEVLVKEGETVEVGTVLARITGTAAAPAAAPPEATVPERTPITGGNVAPPPTTGTDLRAARLREHLRASRERVPAGMCAREISAGAALDRLAGAAEEAAGRRHGLTIATLPPAMSHLVVPALPDGTTALLQAGAPRRGARLLTLCYDRRALDDWSADQILGEVAAAL